MTMLLCKKLKIVTWLNFPKIRKKYSILWVCSSRMKLTGFNPHASKKLQTFWNVEFWAIVWVRWRKICHIKTGIFFLKLPVLSEIAKFEMKIQSDSNDLQRALILLFVLRAWEFRKTNQFNWENQNELHGQWIGLYLSKMTILDSVVEFLCTCVHICKY